MKIRKLVAGILIGTMAAGLLTACGRGPSQKEETEQKVRPLNDDTVITLYQHETDQIVEMPLGEYLCGVIAGEMDVNWPLEALAAQAMVARTFTIEKIRAGGVEARGTDASTDITEFQAYNAEKINDNVRQAVKMTANQIVCYQKKPIKAWFFSDGGGLTAASALEGLGYDKEETPYIHSVEDPGSTLSDNPNGTWEAVFPMEKVVAAVKEVSGQQRDSFTEASIGETGPSGRATKMKLDDLLVSVPALRLALGGEEMKSAMLTGIAIKDGQLVLQGKGYGHGVGMSQWGARAMAEEGKSAEEIITYFFKDVEITTGEKEK